MALEISIDPSTEFLLDYGVDCNHKKVSEMTEIEVIKALYDAIQVDGIPGSHGDLYTVNGKPVAAVYQYEVIPFAEAEEVGMSFPGLGWVHIFGTLAGLYMLEQTNGFGRGWSFTMWNDSNKNRIGKFKTMDEAIAAGKKHGAEVFAEIYPAY